MEIVVMHVMSVVFRELEHCETVTRHWLMDCSENRKWRNEFWNEILLNMNKKLACKNILECTKKDYVRNLVRYLDELIYKWLKKVKYLQTSYYQILNGHHR